MGSLDLTLPWWELVGRLAGAAALGGVLGLEREIDGQDAGFRTHLLLALGAALFGVASVHAFAGVTAEASTTNVRVDVTRIASYVAAGVGFIGGGAIVKTAGVVKGITTAASLWSTAAIGLAAGLGLWVGALAATVAALSALVLLQPINRLVARARHRSSAQMAVLVLAPDADVAGVLAVIRDHGGEIHTIELGAADRNGGLELQVGLRVIDEAQARTLLAELGERADVRSARTGLTRA